MPYTTVVAGTTITASWANANVRDQVVTPFATAAARTSAITAPVEGMVTHLNDSDDLWRYTGSVWAPVAEKVVGAKYATGGTLATSSVYGTEVAMAAWTGGDATVPFLDLYLYRISLEVTSYTADAAVGTHTVTIRRTVNSTSAAVVGTWQFRGNYSGPGHYRSLRAYVKNASGATINASLGLSITTVVGGGNATLFGDATYPAILTVTRLGLTADYSGLGAIARAIT